MSVDCTEWTIQTLKAFHDAELAAVESSHQQQINDLERRGNERILQLQDTMRLEREAIDRRFEAANRFKETYNDSLNRLNTETLKRAEYDSRMSSFQEKIDFLGRTNWPLYSSFGGIAISMVVGLWVIIGLKIDATNQPVVVALEQSKITNESRDRSISDLRQEFARTNQGYDTDLGQKSRDISNLQQVTEAGKADRSQINDRLRRIETSASASQVADANSQTDRKQLNDRVHEIEGTISVNSADRKANEASIRASLVEVETQFCASDIVRNLMHANDLRVLSILWTHGKLGTYPTDNSYYPMVCNRNVNPK